MSTVGWGEVKEPQKAERKEIERLKFSNDKVTRIRLVGGVLPRYVYWVTTSEGKRVPIECLQFVREKEMFDNSLPDPVQEIPDEIYGASPNEKAQFAYVCNVIDRSDDDKVKLFDLKKTIYSQIFDLAQNNDYGNPADPDKGYILSIKREKTGPLPQNVKYTVTPGRSDDKLTEEDTKKDLYDLEVIFKRPTYDEQKEWLMKNTNYFASAGSEFTPDGEEESMEDLTS